MSKQIRKQYSKKYNIELSNIDLSISKEDAAHAFGKINLSNNSLDKKENFLAVLLENEWHLVFDGSEISCQLLRKYSFPKELNTGEW